MTGNDHIGLAMRHDRLSMGPRQLGLGSDLSGPHQ